MSISSYQIYYEWFGFQNARKKSIWVPVRKHDNGLFFIQIFQDIIVCNFSCTDDIIGLSPPTNGVAKVFFQSCISVILSVHIPYCRRTGDTHSTKIPYCYRPQGKVMFNVFTGVSLSTIGLVATSSLLDLVTARSVRIYWNAVFLSIDSNEEIGRADSAPYRVQLGPGPPSNLFVTRSRSRDRHDSGSVRWGSRPAGEPPFPPPVPFPFHPVINTRVVVSWLY